MRLPINGELNPELKVGRTELYEMMGLKLIEYSQVSGERRMDGASMCRLYEANKNKPSTTRGGYRKRKEPKTPSEPAHAAPASQPPGASGTPGAANTTPDAHPVSAANKASLPPGEPPLSSPVTESKPERVAIPEPPRRPDGKILWDEVPDELLEEQLKQLSSQELATAWKVTRGAVNQQLAKRRKLGRLGGPGAEQRRFTKPRKLDLFELLWSKPASQIAADIMCSQAHILGWADSYGLTTEFRPGHKYWQREKSGIKVSIPTRIKRLYLTLYAEASAQDKPAEVPVIFRLTESELAGKEELGQAETSEAQYADIQPIEWKISKAKLLEMCWQGPATRVAEELHVPVKTIYRESKDLKSFLPPENYWRSRKSGDLIVIPDHVKQYIAKLRAEEGPTPPVAEAK